MAFTVCLPLPHNGWYQMQWDYILSSLPCDTLYVIGDETDAPKTNVFAKLAAAYIPDASALPADPLVILAADNGRDVTGVEDLTGFVHPKDAIYFFGGDVEWVTDTELGGRDPDYKVFIPTATHDDLWSWMAYGITAWDRVMKRG